ncbi:MAG: Holliday junction branch migration DNA helicase RuvB, partial [Cutibacterium sp.]
RRVRDWADVHHESPVTPQGAETALDLYEVDPLGLDRLDRAVLHAVCLKFGGGPVGLSTLAISVGEEPQTVEEVAEPFLVRLGFLMRTPRGRVATDRAWRHLGLEPPPDSSGEGLF